AGGPADPSPFRQSMAAPLALDYLDMLALEKEVLGFYHSSHPLDAYGAELAKISGLKQASDVEAFAAEGGGICKLAGLVQEVREVRTKTGKRMAIITLTDQSGKVDVAVFSEAYAQYQELLESQQPLLLDAKISHDGERLRV